MEYLLIRLEQRKMKTIAEIAPRTAPRDCIRKTMKKQKQAEARKQAIEIKCLL
jgi:hypothetical protein